MRATSIFLGSILAASAFSCGTGGGNDGGSTGTDGGIVSPTGDTGTTAPADGSTTPAPECALSIRPRSEPVEYVGLSIEKPAISLTDLIAFLDPIFGTAAQGGHGFANSELQPGVKLTSTVDPRTADQGVVSMQMIPSPPGDQTPRTILRVPVSYAYGRTFMDTVQASVAMANSTFANSPEDSRPFHLEYQTTSVNGGYLQLRLDWNAGITNLTITTQGPTTSLHPGDVNRGALTGDPYETIGGTVFFDLSRDEFAFFTNRAYGVTSGAAQNFHDFQLQPHNWMHLTVTPRFEDKLVDVGFEVVTADNRRIPFAKAPASVIAGDQFQQNVFRLVDNMLAQETAHAGSSTPWSSPFYYDDPTGGGVVEVLASGRAGVFTIAYAVATPAHPLRDTEFVTYTSNVQIPDHSPVAVMTTCADVGSTEAVHGRFRVKITASSTVRQSTSQHGPLRGPVWFDIYHASDVTIVGPNAGAVAVGSFHFDNIDSTDPDHLAENEIPIDLPAGTYQILGFMDTNNNASATAPNPDQGDPVTLPIGSYTMQCASQPITIEFALLLPAGH